MNQYRIRKIRPDDYLFIYAHQLPWEIVTSRDFHCPLHSWEECVNTVNDWLKRESIEHPS